MPSQILDALNGLVTSDLTTRASSALGESELGVAKGLGAAFPALLTSLADRSGDEGVARQLFSLVTDPANDGGALRDPARLVAERPPALAGLAGSLLDLLFGGRIDGIAAALARYAGIRSASAASLIQLAAPLVLGVLGDRVRRDGLGAQGLLGWIAGQRDALRSALPRELAPALGERPRAASVPPRPARASWLWPALIALALIGGYWLFARSPELPRSAETRGVAAEPPAVSAAPPPGALVRRSLPGGIELRLPENGLEVRLVGFLEDASRVPADDVWFDFDRIQFETGSAALRDSSRQQLRDVAAILGAYPAVRVKIGSYTDDTGDPTANRTLSQARAESVRSQLVFEGIAANRIEAEGYGEKHPVASNANEEGRARNRRIALRVTDK